MTTHGGRLPAETSRFFGRSVEYAATADALGRSRLVTLTGPGGVGKTRLAVKVAAERGQAFPDGVFLADLSAARDAAAVARTVAAAVGLPGRAGPPAGAEGAGAEGAGAEGEGAGAGEPGTGWLAGRLRGQRLLLILDTCEHLVDECAALADAILRAGGPALLVTSRQPLGLPAEVVFRIPPLAVDDALGLFADRAAAAVPGFAVTPVALPRLARLCGLLDGIPLAIELAALRLRAVGLDELLARLPGRLRLLGSGRTAAGDRQQSLQASISWSYDLCSPAERLLWARLPVFADTFDLVAAEQMCAGDGLAAEEILGTLIGLVDKSVVLRAPDNGGTARYQLLGIVREHGAAVLTGITVPRQARPSRSRPGLAGPGAGPARPVTGRGEPPRPAGGPGPAAGGAAGGELDDAASAGHWAMLTTREREVAGLVALGLTSKDIAARLVVSKRTVDSHLEHILGKLGYNSRVQVAALASYELSRGQRDGQRHAPE